MIPINVQSTSNLVIPVVLWGRSAPKHRISCIRSLPDTKTIVTGTFDGELIIWENISSVLNAKLLLIGHERCVTCLSPTSLASSSTRFISSSSDGQIILWDSTDGRCIDSVFTNYIHRRIAPYSIRSADFHTCRLYCLGDYSEIVVLDPQDLNILFTLGSRVEPDWLSAITFARPSNSSDMVIGVSFSGMIKIWHLIEIDKKDNAQPLYEYESKNIDDNEILSISWSQANPSVFLLVTSNSWQMFSLTDLNRLYAFDCVDQLCDGSFLYSNVVAVACSSGVIKLYLLPDSVVKDLDEEKNPIKKATIISVIGENSPLKNGYSNYVSFYFNVGTNDASDLIYRADIGGNIYAWKISDIIANYERKSENHSLRPSQANLTNLWDKFNCPPPSLMDNEEGQKITAILYISLQGRLVLGRDDGSILIMYACDALSKQLLENESAEINCRHLCGHTSSISCLIYPHEEHSRYDRQIFVSGSVDFSVIVWNINTGSRLFRFCVQGGPILRFLIPPYNCNARILRSICSVAGDNSVALLSLKENKCLLLASRQLFPVVEIKWRPLDDFMLLKCEDDSVYIWQMDTANLERVVTGTISEEILSACEEQVGIIEGDDEAGASQAIQMLRAFRNKNINAVRQIASGGQEEKSNIPITSEKGTDLPPPMAIMPLRKVSDTAYIILFNIDSIIVGLQSIENEASPTEMENKSLSTILKNKPHEPRPARIVWQTESNLHLDVAKFCLSLLHAWTLDADLDAVCLKSLRLSKPLMPLNFGIASRQGYISVLLPTEAQNCCPYPEINLFDQFSSNFHWSLNSSLSTIHLMAIISLANTLLSLREASVVPNTKRGLIRKTSSSRSASSDTTGNENQLKQGWSLLAAMHCCLLPDLVKSKAVYCSPRIELLARRWQDRCLEIRLAAQALLTRELNRMGMKGRKRLMESWAPFLPTLLDPTLSIFGARTATASMNMAPPCAVQPPPIPPRSGRIPLPAATMNVEAKLEMETGLQQIRRNQATAVILFGVIGADFPDELNRLELSRATAQSLLELLIAPPSALLPMHSPLRRAAIDLIGRGFCIWQPHFDITKVLLGLLDLSACSEKYNLEKAAILEPAVDACRTARHALSLIASLRPPALITALSKEVARYNSAAQHQTIQHAIVSPVLKSRTEVLRIIEQLSEKQYSEVADLILPVGEILVHCLDTSLLKHKTLSEVFPPITKFYMVAYCANTRRIAFGGRNGSVVVHELRTAKTQTLQAHTGTVTSVSFSEDGKYLATYGAEEAKLSFWQTSQSFLGMGQSQLRCIRTQAAPSIFPVLSPCGTIQPFKARLVWIGSKSVTLMLPNGKEYRFTV